MNQDIFSLTDVYFNADGAVCVCTIHVTYVRTSWLVGKKPKSSPAPLVGSSSLLMALSALLTSDELAFSLPDSEFSSSELARSSAGIASSSEDSSFAEGCFLRVCLLHADIAFLLLGTPSGRRRVFLGRGGDIGVVGPGWCVRLGAVVLGFGLGPVGLVVASRLAARQAAGKQVMAVLDRMRTRWAVDRQTGDNDRIRRQLIWPGQSR